MGSIFAVVAAAFFGIGLIAVGVALLLWPAWLLWRAMKSAAGDLPPAVPWLALGAAIWLVPEPFLAALRFLITVAWQLLGSFPSRLVSAAAGVTTACENPSQNCALIMASGFSNLFYGEKSESQVIELPPHLSSAVGVIVSVIALGWLCRRRMVGNRAHDSRTATHLVSAVPLLLSIIVALYLSVTAIVAVPVFNDRPTKVDEAAASLTKEITEFPTRYAARVKRAALTEDQEKWPSTDDLRDLTRPVPPDHPQSGDEVAREAEQSGIANSIISYMQSAIEQWKSSAAQLDSAVDAFPDNTQSKIQFVHDSFVDQNNGRVGGTLTDRHKSGLVVAYGLWLESYAQAVEQCHNGLLATRGDIQGFRNSLILAISNKQDLRAQVWRARPIPTCADMPPSMVLPHRQDPGETLGYFGEAANWLLSTESPALALITGLLGFGFFGALAAGFVREFAANQGAALPRPGFIVSALVSGVAAAIVVFLAVMGGIAIFAQSGTDPKPNPYAVFLACLVAAVFSEDVWRRARRWQHDQFGDGTDGTHSARSGGEHPVSGEPRPGSGATGATPRSGVRPRPVPGALAPVSEAVVPAWTRRDHTIRPDPPDPSPPPDHVGSSTVEDRESHNLP